MVEVKRLKEELAASRSAERALQAKLEAALYLATDVPSCAADRRLVLPGSGVCGPASAWVNFSGPFAPGSEPQPDPDPIPAPTLSEAKEERHGVAATQATPDAALCSCLMLALA